MAISRSGFAKPSVRFTVSAIIAASVGTVAHATDGYFQYGYGARQEALGGAGVADSRDAMSLSLNPAGLVDAGNQLQLGAALFAPFRSYDATGTMLVAPGSYDSRSNYFAVPNMAYSRQIDADSAFGIALYGNGGMNTNWPAMTNTSPGCSLMGPAPGVFCGGRAGVDMMQAFVAAGYARRVGTWSFGVSPVLAMQRFKAEGLAAFSVYSSDPEHLTNKGYSYSYGGGLHAGVQWSATPTVRLGFAGQTPVWMTRFDDYRGLFAGSGGFDIPANLTFGAGWDATSDLTLMLDYQHIFYGSIPSIANSSAITNVGVLGTRNGPGFGWQDTDGVKLGVEWRATPTWTLRAGYEHNNNPVPSVDVTINILAPGVVTNHFTGGLAYKATSNSTIEFAAAYVPSSSVSGPERLGPPFPVPTPGSNIEVRMHQYQFGLGWTYQFDK
jgi:long-chain fatty acid transport protein